MPHALIVGGSGMLLLATQALLADGYEVSLLARRADRVAGVNPLRVDYTDTPKLLDAISDLPPVDLIIAWIHSTAPHAPLAIAETVKRGQVPLPFFHVLGSAHANPARPRPPHPVASVPEIRYHQVILGFVVEGGRSRWLTHQEISGGVLDALRTGADRFIVGTVEPWSLRP